MSTSDVYNPSTPPSASPSSASASDSSESSDGYSAPVVPRTRCQHPGRRLIGGRIYDSILGVTCHWCRQKTVEDHVYCCQCTIAFCGGCLKNRHGELIHVEMKEDVNWVCPRCRGGCGRGCRHCCNCGPCRKAQGLEPTGLLVHTARAYGFTNVHDYLIHKKTGESQETIAERKQGKGWCQTGESSLTKKQRKIENDKVERTTEDGCRKRLCFDSFDSRQQAKNMSADDKQLLPDSLQKKVGNQPKIMPADEELHPPGLLQTKQDDHEELKKPKNKAAPSSSEKVSRVQPKSEPDLHPQSKSSSSPYLQPPQVMGVRPPLHVKVKVEPVTPHAPAEENLQQVVLVKEEPCELGSSPYLQPPQVMGVRPPLHVKVRVEPVVPHVPAEENSQQVVLVKEEPCELGPQPPQREPMNAANSLLRVKIEQMLMFHEGPSCAPVTQYQQLKQVKEELLDRLVQVKEELQDQSSQALDDDGSANQPNVFATAFSRSESDAAWGRFSSDFEFPFEKGGGVTPPATSGNFETHPNGIDARDLTGLSTSEIHLNRSGDSIPVLLDVKKERIDEEQQKPLAVVTKLESMDSQEARCNTASLRLVKVEGCKDGITGSLQDSTYASISYFHPKSSLLTATVKEEREDCWNKQGSPLVPKSTMSFSQRSTSLHTVKVKEEGEAPRRVVNVPSLHPSNAKDKGFLASQEVIVDTEMSEGICIDGDDCPVDGREASSGMKKSSGLGAVAHLWNADDFKSRLEAKLSEPFSIKELEILTQEAIHRKPIYKARETRQGCSQFISQEEGYSYLDHHPDLAAQLQSSSSPVSKLSLLRGFFFWLEHASTQGAFKPWTSVSRSSETPDQDDCVEVDGPDCEILAVVCSVDEEVHGANLARIMSV